MRYFPIFLDLGHRPAVIVGGGEEALRKIRLIERTPARLLVVAETLIDEIAAHPRVEWIARRFRPDLLDGAGLVISAEPALNAEVFTAARDRNLPVNAVDDAERSTFLIPSIVDRDPVIVAIGTEGAAPVLGQSIRSRIDVLLPSGLGSLALQAASLRRRVAAALPAGPRRRAFWTAFFAGRQDGPQAWTRVEALLAGEPTAGPAAVTFIAAADGETDLMTLRAQRRLMLADVIVHDPAGVTGALEMSRRDATREAAGSDAVALIARAARAGKQVVRLSAETLPVSEIEAIERMGLSVECLGAAAPLPVPVSSPAILRAAS
jgi:uroporphyrin-III C-methyltransferase / precorrin-2 dehydrogenase / sirohydrochlorin ferrochelatase